ncbi:hypothetical protein FOL47_001082, partial [Perkinsus chesapeaki]
MRCTILSLTILALSEVVSGTDCPTGDAQCAAEQVGGSVREGDLSLAATRSDVVKRLGELFDLYPRKMEAFLRDPEYRGRMSSVIDSRKSLRRQASSALAELLKSNDTSVPPDETDSLQVEPEDLSGRYEALLFEILGIDPNAPDAMDQLARTNQLIDLSTFVHDVDDLLRYCRRKNLVYVRRRDAKLATIGNRNLPSKTPVGAIDYYSEPPVQEVSAMPVEDVATADADVQTDCRLFVSNLSYEVNEKQVLDALRSVLRLSGVVPISVRLFRNRDTGRNRGLGLIELGDPKSATKALSLNGKKVLGRPIRVRPDNGGQRGAKRQRVEGPEATQEVKEENDDTAVQVGAVEQNTDDDVPIDDSPSRSETAYVVEAIVDDASTAATKVSSESTVTINLKNIGIKTGGSSPLTTIRTDILIGSQTSGSTHNVEWLLDSGCALHLISDSESEWLNDAKVVPLPSPVRLSFANGANQLVTEAREITLQCANRTYCTSVLVVPKLAVRGILSLHQLVHDFGSVVWHLSALGEEMLQLGRHILLKSSGNDCSQQPEGSACAAVDAVPSLAFVQSLTDEKFSDPFVQSLQEGHQEE